MKSENNAEVAEAEVKMELTQEEFRRMPETLLALNFHQDDNYSIVDYYLDYEMSGNGGYNFSRVRETTSGFTITEKHWKQDNDGRRIRIEDESMLDSQSAQTMISAVPGNHIIRKERTDFRGGSSQIPMTISLDQLEISKRTRFFIEVEMIVPPEIAAAAHDSIMVWMKKELHLEAETEAPSMLQLLLTSNLR